MARPFPLPITNHFQSLPFTIGIFVSIFALVALCARRGTKSSTSSRYDHDLYEVEATKKTTNNHNNNNKKNELEVDPMDIVDETEGFGEGGLWQKDILMGEKCQPLEFSGVIYYDNYGKKISQPPRSPRPSAAGSWQGTMSFPVSGRSSSDTN